MTKTTEIVNKVLAQIAEKVEAECKIIKSDIETYSSNLNIEFVQVSHKVRSIANDLRNDPTFSNVADNLNKTLKIAEANRFKDPARNAKSTYTQLTAAKADAMVRHLSDALDTSKRLGSANLQERLNALKPSLDTLSNNKSAIMSNLQRLKRIENRVESNQKTITKPPSI